jgi:hypothetical protein
VDAPSKTIALKNSRVLIRPGPLGDRQGLVDELSLYGYNSGYIFGPIAQLGARLNGIEKAEGSNPSGSTKSLGRSIRPSFSELGERGVSPTRCPRSTALSILG